jgi:threonine-phosphate decarboxylase
LSRICDFGLDVNPLGVPERIRRMLREHVDDIASYPDPDAHDLREAIAGAIRVPPNRILPGNGSAELIGLLAELPSWRRALVIAPTFTEYSWALAQRGRSVEYAIASSDTGFLPEIEHPSWTSRLARADVVFLCNPNNPTGTALPKTRVLTLASRCRRAGATLLVDEAFVDFVERPETVTVLPEAMSLGNVLVLRSLTKCFAMPGLRLGYLVGPKRLITTLRALQSPWPLNAFAAAVGPTLLTQRAYLQRSRACISRQRRSLLRSLAALEGISPFPSAVNFILCRLTTHRLTSGQLTRRLADAGLLVRNCDSFTGLEAGKFVRMAVRPPAEQHRLLCALQQCLRDAG